MNKALFAKMWFGIIALQVIVVIPIRLVVDWNNQFGQFDTSFARSLNVIFYFTNLSNIFVAVVSIFLMTKLNRPSPKFQVLQLASLICIIVAGAVYWLLLASEDKVKGIDIFTNFAVHATVPAMFTIGWFVFVAHGYTTLKTVKLALMFPISWAVFAMLRGALVDWYPYPFMDVRDLGYLTALINMAVVTVFFLVLFFGAYLADTKILSRTKSKN